MLMLQQKTENVNLKRYGACLCLCLCVARAVFFISCSVGRYAIELMKTAGSFQYCVRVMRDLRELMLAEIQALGGNPALVAIIEALCKDVL